MIDKLQTLFDKPILLVYDYNGDYAVTLDDDTESIYIVDGDLFNIIKVTTYYMDEGAYINSYCNVIYDANLNV